MTGALLASAPGNPLLLLFLVLPVAFLAGWVLGGIGENDD